MKILLLDIETAPNKVYAWGLFKQNISINQIVEPGYTMCWAAKWLGKREIIYDGLNIATEQEMVEHMWHLLDEADAVVHYNGTKFDMPTLNREFVKLGYEPPSPYHQIDLLRTVRSQFRMTSNKLDYVAQYLGLGQKTAHTGMQLWTDCMNGDEKAWKLMEKYNKQDVKLLEELYKELLPWIKNHPNHGLYMDTKRPVCTNCGSHHVVKKGVEHTLTQSYQRYKCKDCGTPLRGRYAMPQDKEARENILRGALK